MTTQTIIDFLDTHKSINVESLIRELEIDKRNFYAIINKKRPIPAHKRGHFYRTLKKYGCLFEFDCDMPMPFYPV